jgi:hypothetical protein
MCKSLKSSLPEILTLFQILTLSDILGSQGLSLGAIRSQFIIPCLGFTVLAGRLGLLFPLAWKPAFTQPGYQSPDQYLPPHLARVILFIIQVVAGVVDLHLTGLIHW